MGWFKSKTYYTDEEQEISPTGRYRIVEYNNIFHVDREVFWWHGGFNQWDRVYSFLNKEDAGEYIKRCLDNQPKIKIYS